MENSAVRKSSGVEQGLPEKSGLGKQVAYGVTFLVGLGGATIFNLYSFRIAAMICGAVGLIGLVTFIGSLRKD